MLEKTPNAQYSTAASGSLPVRIAAWQRRRMFERFLAETGIGEGESLLDVGATSERTFEASNYVEAWYPHKHRITAVGLDDASFLEEAYPGMRFVRGDGKSLPFADGEFDVVHSSAVLEHVGGLDEQVRFIAECGRVAGRVLHMTTPNRWFPVEFHTVLPLVHWLPKPVFRGLMRRTGRGFFAEEANLNLMGAGELAWAAYEALPDFDVEVSSVRLLGWPSNLLLTARRKA